MYSFCCIRSLILNKKIDWKYINIFYLLSYLLQDMWTIQIYVVLLQGQQNWTIADHERIFQSCPHLYCIDLLELHCVCQMADLQQEHNREIEGLLENIRQLSRELRLQMLIIDNFIPQEYQVCFLIIVFAW